MYVGVVELLRNLPLYGGGFVLTVNMRLRYPARRSYRTIGRVGPSERDFASQRYGTGLMSFVHMGNDSSD